MSGSWARVGDRGAYVASTGMGVGMDTVSERAPWYDQEYCARKTALGNFCSSHLNPLHLPPVLSSPDIFSYWQNQMGVLGAKEGAGGDERDERRWEQSAEGAEEVTRINSPRLTVFPKAASEHVCKILRPSVNLPKTLATGQASWAQPRVCHECSDPLTSYLLLFLLCSSWKLLHTLLLLPLGKTINSVKATNFSRHWEGMN